MRAEIPRPLSSRRRPGPPFPARCHAGQANSHLQLCCLVDMVLGTGKPAPPLMQAKKASRIVLQY